jgi:hypothetical protein
MFIPIEQVQSWEDLEIKVQSFFNELGYEAKVNHPVTLANGGQAVVDVYAEKPDAPLLQKILFECKYWKTEVPRAIVQSFKMDVLESGANFGVIVSKTGFQSGAYEGVALTTVKLYTFEELQLAFAKEWAVRNLYPLAHKQNILVDLYRHFQIGHSEHTIFEKMKFNKKLEDAADEVKFALDMALSVFKDYFSIDPLKPIGEVSHSIPSPSGKVLAVSFHDARSMSLELNRLLDYANALWRQFNQSYKEELHALPEHEQAAVFKSILSE